MAYNSQADEYLVAWHDYRAAATTDADIYYQIVDSSGERVLSSPGSLVVANWQGEAAAAYNPDQAEYLILFEDERPGTNSSDIYGQVISPDGGLVGSAFEVSGASGVQYQPGLAYHPGGGRYLSVWHDKRNSGHYDVYGQIITGGGTLLGSDLALSTISGSNNNQRYARIAAGETSGLAEFVVIWQDRRNDVDRDIYLQRVDLNGALLDEPDTAADETDPTVNRPVAVDSSAYFARPAAAYDEAEGSYLLAWNSRGDGGIYIQRYSAITPTAPVAGFSVTPESGPAPLVVTVVNTSSGQVVTSTWNFGDGSAGLETAALTVAHTYQTTGSYTITLTAGNPGGSSSASRVVTVGEQTVPTLHEDFEGFAVGETTLSGLA